MFRPEKFYHDQTIELIAGRVVSIDRAGHKVLLASGETLAYGHLVLATGARNRLLDLPNANLPDVKYLRILDESEALRTIIPSKTRVVVIGAGFIGLEFAATARIKGLEVDVLELAPRVMARAVTAEVSDYFQQRHREAGIRIHLGVQGNDLAKIHAIQLIAAEDKQILPIVIQKVNHVLAHRIRSPLIP